MTNERVVWRKRSMNPETQQRRKYENPMFPKQQAQKPRNYAGLIVGIVLVLVIAAYITALRLPAFDIKLSTIEGNQFIPLTTIESGLESYMQQKAFGVFPRRNYFVFSNEGAIKYLNSVLTADQAVETLTIQKKYFSLVAISLVERVPNLVYNNGGKSFLIDRKGVIASENSGKVSASFPVLFDQTTRQVSIGDNVLSESTVQSVFSIRDAMKDHTDIPIDFFYIPPATCLTLTTTEEIPNPEYGRSTNTNGEDESNSNSTTNSNSRNTNKRVNSNTSNTNASNSSVEPEDDKFIETERVIYDCEKESIPPVHEVRIRSSEDWEIYFRLSDSIDDQITRLVRVIREKQLDRNHLDYIDLRFGEQVVYK